MTCSDTENLYKYKLLLETQLNYLKPTLSRDAYTLYSAVRKELNLGFV